MLYNGARAGLPWAGGARFEPGTAALRSGALKLSPHRASGLSRIVAWKILFFSFQFLQNTHLHVPATYMKFFTKVEFRETGAGILMALLWLVNIFLFCGRIFEF
jgi:hypothetical protein